MIALRYQTYRRFHALGAVLLILSLLLGIFFRDSWASAVFEMLVVVIFVINVGAGIAIVILRKLGRLEFVYIEKDRFSYLYNAERQHELRREAREARRRKEGNR